MKVNYKKNKTLILRAAGSKILRAYIYELIKGWVNRDINSVLIVAWDKWRLREY